MYQPAASDIAGMKSASCPSTVTVCIGCMTLYVRFWPAALTSCAPCCCSSCWGRPTGTLTTWGPDAATGMPLGAPAMAGVDVGGSDAAVVEVGPILLQVAANRARGEGVGLFSCWGSVLLLNVYVS